MNWGPLSIPAGKASLLILEITALSILIGLIWTAVRRQDRRRLKLRILAIVLSVFALLMLALRPQWRTELKITEAILVTSGTDASQFRDFLNSNTRVSRVFSLDKNADFRETIAVPDLAFINRNYPEIRMMHVFGHGLHDYDWQEVKDVAVQFHRSLPEPGIQNIWWKRLVHLGEQVHVQGKLTRGDGWLILMGPAGEVDSTQINDQEKFSFNFQSTPPDTGLFLYNLIFKTKDGNLVFDEKIDVLAVPTSNMKILILENAPRFETKYLKNWLAEQKHSVVIRTTISRERFRFEFLNHSKVPLNRLTSNLLKDFDLIIIDGKSLQSLTNAERNSIKSGITDDGLGALIVPDEIVLNGGENSFSDRSFFLNFNFEKFPDLEYRTVKLTMPNFDDITIAATAEPFAIKEDVGLKPVIKDNTGQILAGVSHGSKGLIGTSLIRNSYKWILAGDSQYHAAYWSRLINELVKEDGSSELWKIRPGPVFVDQPIDLHLVTSSNYPAGMMKTESGVTDIIYLRQDRINPRQWWGIYWPKHEGWHRISTQTGNPLWFYAQKPHQWKSWQQNQKISATEQFAALSAMKEDSFVEITQRFQAISLLWFFLLFLAGSAFLWLERKI